LLISASFVCLDRPPGLLAGGPRHRYLGLDLLPRRSQFTGKLFSLVLSLLPCLAKLVRGSRTRLL
jgi:hypothetical protein